MRRQFQSLFTVLVLFVLALGASACSPSDEEDDAGDVDAVAIDLEVDQDDIFGHVRDEIIGDIWFSDSQGPVGTPVTVVVQLEDYGDFKDAALAGLITLANPTSIKLDDWSQEFVVDSDREEFTIIIPQVVSVPAVLNFEVTLSSGSEADPEDLFMASLVYQFLVNQGTPAT